jgi:hypothetical protein
MEIITKEQVLIVLDSHLKQIGHRFLSFCNSDNKADRIQYISDIRHIATDVRNYVRRILYEYPGTLPPKMALNHDEARPNFDLFALNLTQAYKHLHLIYLVERQILDSMLRKEITDSMADLKFREAQRDWIRYLEVMGRIASDLAIYALHLPVDYIEPYALEKAKILTGE